MSSLPPIVLSAPRRANFLAEAQNFRPQGPNPLPELLEFMPKLAAHLAILGPVLKQDLAQNGYSFIQGLPIDLDLPDPPTDGKRPCGKTWVTELVLLAVAYLLGHLPLAYLQESPELFTQVTPKKGQELALSSAGSLKPLDPHTDGAIMLRQYRIEWLFLIGLMNESKTPTFIANIEDALGYLSLAHQEVLSQPLFRVQLPPSYSLFNGKLMHSEPRAILSETNNGLECAVNFYGTQAINAEAQAALNAIKDVFGKIATPIVIAPGSLLVFDNHKIIHGRPAISSGKRWLQRLFTRQDLSAIRQATNTDENTFVFDVSKIVLE